jgi:hypothetical protein
MTDMTPNKCRDDAPGGRSPEGQRSIHGQE